MNFFKMFWRSICFKILFRILLALLLHSKDTNATQNSPRVFPFKGGGIQVVFKTSQVNGNVDRVPWIAIQRLKSSEYAVNTTLLEGCQFGKYNYSLGDKWHPDLPPFGVIRCVTCSCKKVPRRPGKIGKVACHDIRDRCPKTSCAHPITLPHQCCPSCPAEFLALLSPKIKPRSSPPVALGVGRIHLILGTRSLSISVLYEGRQKLKDVVFVGPRDRQLKKINVPRRATNGSKTCLMWNRVDNRTVSMLQDGLVTVSFKFKKRAVGELYGVIKPSILYSEVRTLPVILTSASKSTNYFGYRELREPIRARETGYRLLESFETLLHPTLTASPKVAGAIASLTLTPSGKIVLIHLTYNGFPVNEQIKIRFHRIINHDKAGRQVKKLRAKFNTTTKAGHVTLAWSRPKEHELKWLTRGVLGISVMIGSSTTVQMKGRIKIKQLCNTLFASLSGRDAPRPTVTGSSGYASFSVDEKGSLHFQVMLSGLTQVVFEINMEATKKRHVIKRLSHRKLVPNEQGKAEVSGVWERPSSTVIYWLFGGELFVNVRTALYRKGEIQGQVRQLPYRGHHISYQEIPDVLSGNEVVPSTQSAAAGQAWFSMDRSCAFHYYIMLSGLDRGNKNELTADLKGFARFGEAALSYEEENRRLNSFYGNTVTGTVRDLSQEFQHNLLRGLVYLQISSEDSPEGELRAQVSLKNNRCANHPTKAPPAKPAPGSCLSEGQHYLNGEVWKPDYDQTCTSCTCMDSKVQCTPVKCKKVTCHEAPVLLPHSCCPVCPVKEENAVQIISDHTPTTEGCYFESDRKVYPSGAVWYPFVRPFGYMKCVVCSCLPNTYQIKCSKVTCPKLTCSNPKRVNPTDCCKRCDDPGSQPAPRAGKSCRFGTKLYPSGARWTPVLPPFGVIRCFICSCLNGKVRCNRVECPKNHCRESSSLYDNCCKPCNRK